MEVHPFKITSRRSTDENLARIRKFGQCTILVLDGSSMTGKSGSRRSPSTTVFYPSPRL